VIYLLCCDDDWISFTWNGTLYQARKTVDSWQLSRCELRTGKWTALPLHSDAGFALRDYLEQHSVNV
jgi:hypothetical protein